MRVLNLIRTAPVSTQLDVLTARLLTEAGKVVVPADRGEDAKCVAILPLEGQVPLGAAGDSIGVALVPEPLDQAVTLNCAPLGAGLHLLRHRDALELGGQRYWLAVRTAVEEVEYDPQRHGSDIFCARTRRRISGGDRVVACPGTPGQRCELIFTATAWRAGVRCHNCGFDPNEKPWSPAAEQESRPARELLDLFRGRRGA